MFGTDFAVNGTIGRVTGDEERGAQNGCGEEPVYM